MLPDTGCERLRSDRPIAVRRAIGKLAVTLDGSGAASYLAPKAGRPR